MLSGAPQLLIPVSLSLLRLTHYKLVYAAGALEVQQLKCCPSPATARRPPITISHATAATDGRLQVWRVILPPNSCLLDRFSPAVGCAENRTRIDCVAVGCRDR